MISRSGVFVGIKQRRSRSAPFHHCECYQHVAVRDHDDQPDSVPTEYRTELAEEEAVEDVDANAVHEPATADTENGGDHTDYAQNVEYDDEDWEEEYPEEVESAVATDVAHAAANDSSVHKDVVALPEPAPAVEEEELIDYDGSSLSHVRCLRLLTISLRHLDFEEDTYESTHLPTSLPTETPKG